MVLSLLPPGPPPGSWLLHLPHAPPARSFPSKLPCFLPRSIASEFRKHQMGRGGKQKVHRSCTLSSIFPSVTFLFSKIRQLSFFLIGPDIPRREVLPPVCLLPPWTVDRCSFPSLSRVLSLSVAPSSLLSLLSDAAHVRGSPISHQTHSHRPPQPPSPLLALLLFLFSLDSLFFPFTHPPLRKMTHGSPLPRF